MIAHWMLYTMAVALLLGAAAGGAERVARLYGRPGRWAWVLSLAGSLALPLAAWLRASPAAAGGSLSFGTIGVLPGAAPTVASPTGLAALLATLSGWIHQAGALESALRAAAAAAAARMDARLEPFGPVLVAFWVMSSMALAAYLVLSAWRLRRALRSSRPARVDGHDVLVSAGTGPAVVGLLRQRIVLPAWVLEEGDAARRMIVAHEREHVAAGDPRLLLLSFLALLVAPWNPALWWQARRLRLALELDCDARVLRGAADRHRYGALLLDVVRRGGAGAWAATFAEPRSLLERRIRALTAAPQSRRGRRALAALAGGALLAAGACGLPHPDAPTNVNMHAPRVPPPTSARAATGATAAGGDTAGVAGPGQAPPPGNFAPNFTAEAFWTPPNRPYTSPPKLANVAETREALIENYPPLLRDAGVGGKVLVWLYIDEDGQVAKTLIMHKDGSGHEALDQAALRVVASMRFEPALNRGTPTPVWIAVPIVFQAKNGHVVPADSVRLSNATQEDMHRIILETKAFLRTEAITPRRIPTTLNEEAVHTAVKAALAGTASSNSGAHIFAVALAVDAEGKVSAAKLLRSSGDARLDASLQTAYRKARFSITRDESGRAVPNGLIEAIPVR